MPWLQLILDAEANTVEPISEALVAIGALSVSLLDASDQPLYEPPLNSTPLWEWTRIVGLFAGNTDPHQLKKQLQKTLTPLPPNQIKTLPDQEWSRVWMNDFQPMSFGKRVWVCPSWQTPPDSQAINILLDPGLAFGSGTHTTTALCLEWLDQQADFITGKTLIDYGCGSGILAITAIKLGATPVWAVDNDPQALEATKDNANKNKVKTAIHPVLPAQLPHIKADAIVANILATPLITLVTSFATHLKRKAPLVLSGILKEQCLDVITVYQPYFTITEIIERDNWIRIVAHKI